MQIITWSVHVLHKNFKDTDGPYQPGSFPKASFKRIETRLIFTTWDNNLPYFTILAHHLNNAQNLMQIFKKIKGVENQNLH